MDFSGGGAAAVSGDSMKLDHFRLAVQVVRGRWFMFFSSFLIMAAAGATYIFSIYSKDIKTSLGYNQSTLNTISFFKDLGANVGILSGLINEVTPPWVVLSLGAAMNLFGYLMIYLAITGRTAPPRVWLMCLYICVGANSQTFANTGALVTCVKNFPANRGIVIGLLKGFVGLSGAIITQLYYAIYFDDSKSLVLLIAWLPAAVSIVFVHTIRIMSVEASSPWGKTPRAFFYFLYISLALAAYLLVAIVVEKTAGNFSRPEYDISATVVVLLLLLPLAVVVKEELNTFHRRKQDLGNPAPISITVEKAPSPTAPIVITEGSEKEKEQAVVRCAREMFRARGEDYSILQAVVRCAREMFRPPARGEDYSILQALVSLDMLVLFVAIICGVGGTLTAIDNLAQIGESLGYPKRSIGTFVTLVSIWNYAGRVTTGFASEILLSKFKFPRPLMLTAVHLLSCVGHLLIAFGVPNSLYFASVVIGFCFGAQWPLIFAIISELFGLKYYSTLYNLGGAASPLGSYLLNVRVAGHLYDVEARKQRKAFGGSGDDRDLTCIGVECFRMSFLIITAVTVVGAAVSLVLVWRTKEFYKGDIYAKFRQQREAAEQETTATAWFSFEGELHDRDRKKQAAPAPAPATEESPGNSKTIKLST
ncbi:protein NUCLEAR FUSION DEFECTIVE 4-like [Curcuma longa]|uniref:protein NUCLEAR FUSION DEFECTIVE 4-like n=1 Tax=Curcuma longa TaxID=136217 RepID=UPI003D9DD4D9